MFIYLLHLFAAIPLSVLAVSNSTDQRYPTAIIVGVKKSGTRALLEFLRLNDNIRAPGPEVHFFDRHFDRGFDWYRKQMPETTSDQVTIEKSPSYFVTKRAPQRIWSFNPKMKLIVVVRDPVTRAISDYTQTASKRPDLPSFERMSFHSDGTVNKSWGAIRIGSYERFVRKWLVYFPLKHIHFVNGEELIDQPAEEVSKVERFLNLSPQVSSINFEMNAEKGFPCIRKSSTAEPHCLGKTKGRRHPTVAKWAKDRLREFYRPFNELFYRLINQRFKW